MAASYVLGPSCSFCHVVPSIELSKVLPAPEENEKVFIEKVPIGKTERCVLCFAFTFSSHLACQVKVTKEMEGGVFFVGERMTCHVDSSPRPE